MGLLGDFIDGFIEGWNETDNNSITAETANQREYAMTTNSGATTTISSLQEMSQWLNTLQKGASPAVKEALSAQINVIRFVQSPTLVDTTFDTLLYSLDKSLRVAKSNEEKAGIREVFCLMIQNYAFFMDAKFQMAVNKNREEGRKLFLEAGEILSNSIKNVALMAVSGADYQQIANTTISNLFAPDNESGGLSGFIKKLINYINQEDIIEEQRELFYKTVETIILKLGEPETKDLLGKSNILSGTIKRYAPWIINYNASRSPVIGIAEKAMQKNKKWSIGIAIVWIIGSLIWAFFRSLYYSIDGQVWGPHGWFGRQMLWTIGILAGIELFFIINSLVKKGTIKKEKQKWDNHLATLNGIAYSYKESLQSYEPLKEPTIVVSSTVDNEQEYLKEVQFMLEDGEIGPRERKSLERARVRLGISEVRAAEIEASVSAPKLTDEEKEYLAEVKAVLEDGEIGPRERKSLERTRNRLGISEERANEIERL